MRNNSSNGIRVQCARQRVLVLEIDLQLAGAGFVDQRVDVEFHGLIALSGAAGGDVGEALLQGRFEQAALCARRWQQLFPDAFYLEVQRYGQPQQEFLVTATADLAAELELPLVATHPIQFL